MEIAQVLPKHNNYVMHTDNKILKIHSHTYWKQKTGRPTQQQPYMLQNYA